MSYELTSLDISLASASVTKISHKNVSMNGIESIQGNFSVAKSNYLNTNSQDLTQELLEFFVNNQQHKGERSGNYFYLFSC